MRLLEISSLSHDWWVPLSLKEAMKKHSTDEMQSRHNSLIYACVYLLIAAAIKAASYSSTKNRMCVCARVCACVHVCKHTHRADHINVRCEICRNGGHFSLQQISTVGWKRSFNRILALCIIDIFLSLSLSLSLSLCFFTFYVYDNRLYFISI